MSLVIAAPSLCRDRDGLGRHNRNRVDADLRDHRLTAPLNMRNAPGLKAAAQNAAADDNRSLTSLFETLLISHPRDRGYLPKPGAPSGTSGSGRTKKPSATPRARKPAPKAKALPM